VSEGGIDAANPGNFPSWLVSMTVLLDVRLSLHCAAL
jgi:hypothetical protein